jgi:hypothetical protein
MDLKSWTVPCKVAVAIRLLGLAHIHRYMEVQQYGCGYQSST